MGNSHPGSVIQYAMIMSPGEMVYESDRVFPSGKTQSVSGPQMPEANFFQPAEHNHEYDGGQTVSPALRFCAAAFDR